MIPHSRHFHQSEVAKPKPHVTLNLWHVRTTEEARCKQSFVLADVQRLRFCGALGWFGEFGRSAVKLVSAQLANQLHLLLLHEVWRSWLGCVCLVDFCLNGLLPGCDWRPCPTNISQIAACSVSSEFLSFRTHSSSCQSDCPQTSSPASLEKFTPAHKPVLYPRKEPHRMLTWIARSL